jgi:cell division protein FtsB
MNKLLQHHSLVRENFAAMVGLCLCPYFFYHAFQGERSFVRLISVNRAIAVASIEHDQMMEDRIVLEKKVRAMRPGSISRDLLEERVREVLGYRHPSETELKSN